MRTRSLFTNSKEEGGEDEGETIDLTAEGKLKHQLLDEESLRTTIGHIMYPFDNPKTRSAGKRLCHNQTSSGLQLQNYSCTVSDDDSSSHLSSV